MARTGSGPSFADRVAAANLSPQQRETAAATLLLAELVDELCGLTARQVAQLDEQNDRLAEQNRLLADLHAARPKAVDIHLTGPAGRPGNSQKGGGEDVRITEPATPPPDKDPNNGPDDGDRPVAEPAAEPAAAGRPPAKKTTSKAAPAKKTTTAATRRGTSGKG